MVVTHAADFRIMYYPTELCLCPQEAQVNLRQQRTFTPGGKIKSKCKFLSQKLKNSCDCIDTFKTKWELSASNNALRDAALGITPFNTLATEEALLGENKNVPVKPLKLAGPMSALHAKLMTLVDKGDFVFNTPEFVGSGFLPHATDQENDKIEIGQEYQLDSVYDGPPEVIR